jgi:hypothetical protein
MHQESNTPAALAGLTILLVLAWGIYAGLSVWSECRASHSFAFCIMLMGR